MTSNTKRDRTSRGSWWTLQRRRYFYGIAVAAGAVATSLGLLTGETVAALLVLAAAVLGVSGMALANPTTD